MPLNTSYNHKNKFLRVFLVYGTRLYIFEYPAEATVESPLGTDLWTVNLQTATENMENGGPRTWHLLDAFCFPISSVSSEYLFASFRFLSDAIVLGWEAWSQLGPRDIAYDRLDTDHSHLFGCDASRTCISETWVRKENKIKNTADYSLIQQWRCPFTITSMNRK